MGTKGRKLVIRGTSLKRSAGFVVSGPVDHGLKPWVKNKQTKSKSNQSILLHVGLTRYFVTLAEGWTDTRNGGLEGKQLLWLPVAMSKSLEMTCRGNLGKKWKKNAQKMLPVLQEEHVRWFYGEPSRPEHWQDPQRLLLRFRWTREHSWMGDHISHSPRNTSIGSPWPDTLWDATFKARRLICWKTL